MRRLVLGAAVVITAGLTGSTALACGDKLLAIARGIRFNHAGAARQASVVLYSAGPQDGAALDSSRLQTALKRAVHNLEVVRGGSELDRVLKSRQVDVVLVYFRDAATIDRELQASRSKTVILPVLVKPSKTDFAVAQKAYPFALKANADELEYLNAIDEAMKVKAKSSPRS